MVEIFYGSYQIKTKPRSFSKKSVVWKKISRINNVVDIANLISLNTFISTSVHDLKKIKQPLFVRKAKNDEEFLAIGSKGSKKVKEGWLVVSDSEKIIDLGISTSSSEKTKITFSTSLLLFLCYAPLSLIEVAKEGLSTGIKLFKKYCNGEVLFRKFFNREKI